MWEHQADRKGRHGGKNNTAREKNARDPKKKGRHDLGNIEMAENVVMGAAKILGCNDTIDRQNNMSILRHQMREK